MLEIKTNEEHFFGTHTIFEKNSKNSAPLVFLANEGKMLEAMSGICQSTTQKVGDFLLFNRSFRPTLT